MDCQCLKKALTAILFLILVSGIVGSPASRAENIAVIKYQGQAEQAGIPYHGTGYFKFSIIDDPLTPHHNIWTHDGSNPAPGHEPDHVILISFESGEFSISLGKAHHNNIITPDDLPLIKSDAYLRVWFSTDGHKFEQLSPDNPLSEQIQDFDAKSANTLEGIAIVSSVQIIDNSNKTTAVRNAGALAAKD